MRREGEERRRQEETQDSPDLLDQVVFLPYMLISPKRMEEYRRECEEEKRKELAGRVDSWRNEVVSVPID